MRKVYVLNVSETNIFYGIIYYKYIDGCIHKIFNMFTLNTLKKI